MTRTRLRVGNLNPNVSEQQLRDLFSEVGEVTSVQRFAAYAFVEMASPTQAAEAIKHFHNYNLDGSWLIVYDVPPRTQPKPH